MPVSTVQSWICAIAILASSSVVATAAAGLPVPFQPAQDIAFKTSTTVVTGKFQRGDGMCRMALASSTQSHAADFEVKAGSKSRVTLAGQDLEVFCCPELKIVTLREVRRAG